MTATKYADPDAAATTLATINDLSAKIRALDLPIEKLCELALLTAHTYIAREQDRARTYFDDQLAYLARLAGDAADTFRDDLAYEAIETLVWTALFGPNGSDGQRAASQTLDWSKEYANE